MTKILITGANSYIGASFENYMKQFDGYQIDTVDMIDGTWREYDFSGYDVVFHVAGIAHQKETRENAHLHYEINRDLVIETANKAKMSGVKQFVFLSSMSVYGINTGIIKKDTMPCPKSNYGKSKLQAEQEIVKLIDDKFYVAIIRPPMVYGQGCKGNFQSVLKIVKKFPVFPRIDNKRSLIYIDNLSSFVKFSIDEKLSGVFFPENSEYISTQEMAIEIASALNKKIYCSIIMGLAVWMFRPFVAVLQKAFGSLIYKDMDEFEHKYCVVNKKDSFRKSII